MTLHLKDTDHLTAEADETGSLVVHLFRPDGDHLASIQFCPECVDALVETIISARLAALLPGTDL